MIIFHYGPMGAGKSTLAIQHYYNQKQQSLKGKIYTQNDRSNKKLLTSRLGATVKAKIITPNKKLNTTKNQKQDFIIIDEAQFLTTKQIKELTQLSDQHNVIITCFGLLTNFKGKLFKGSKKLIEKSDKIIPLPLEIKCHCGNPGIINARIINNQIVKKGKETIIGDTTTITNQTHYQVLCRKHWNNNHK